MIFLGTGGAQLIPAAFCECELCKNVRKSDDRRNIRARSSFQIDAENLIDLGPDTNYFAAVNGISFHHTKNIFFTHTDPDHYSMVNCFNLRKVTEPLTADWWFAADAIEPLMQYLHNDPAGGSKKEMTYFTENITLHAVKPYETYRAGDMDVTAVVAHHKGMFKETALNYVFERGGRRFIYATDTGLWCDENYAFLKDKPADILVLECTHGPQEIAHDSSHLSFTLMAEMVERLRQAGIFTDKTRLYATHINHKCGMMHADFDARMKALFGPNAAAGYDGQDIGPF